MTEPKTDQRRFSRIAFNASADLHQGDKCWSVRLIDISLNGLLAEEPEQFHIVEDQPLHATVHLTDHTGIDMAVSLIHRANRQLGFMCESIDVDSISHLRRLIELNLGDTRAAERELAELLDD